ncbi:MAG: hypothetical protein R3D00_25130 [Bacteroidia bacterium]
MELKIKIAYEQVIEIIRQLPVNQIARLLVDAKGILEKEKPHEDISAFQRFLLTAPTMSDEQYEMFVENRKMFNQWRKK